MNGTAEGSEGTTTMPQYPSPSVEAQDSRDSHSQLDSGTNPASAFDELHRQLKSDQPPLPHSSESTEPADSPDEQPEQTQQGPSISNAEELQLAAQLGQDLSSITSMPPEGEAAPAAVLPSSADVEDRDPEQQARAHSSPRQDQQLSASRPPEQVTQPQLPHHQDQPALSMQPLPPEPQPQTSQAVSASIATPVSAPPLPPQRVPPTPQTHVPVAPRPRPQASQPTPPQHPQPSQYAQDHHQPVLAPQLNNPLDPHQIAVQYAGAAQYAAAAAAMDNTPPRKRSKVSRACDECRRKKVKCDAQSETGEDACSNCRRSNMQCLFSRVPQKRGPSKGYIKELADRINHIEGKLGSGAVRDVMGGIVPPGAEAALAQSALEGASGERKRPYSSISTDAVSRLASWPSEGAMHAFDTSRAQPSYHPDSLATPGSEPRPISEDVVDFAQAGGAPRDVDENSFLRYQNTVHPYLPFLPSTKAKLVTGLSRAPATISQAFVDAFHLAMGVLTAPTPDLASVLKEIVDWEITRGKPRSAADLIHVQTLLLAALSAENAGPNPESPLTTTSFIRKAVDVIFAYSTKPPFQFSSISEVDTDCEERMWIRAWWSLVIMDRFSSIAWASPPAIANHLVVLIPSHKPVLGVSVYRIAGLAELLGTVIPLMQLPIDLNASLPSVGAIRGIGTALLNQWRQGLPDTVTPTTHPLVHMTYWYTRAITEITSLAPPFNDPAAASQLKWCVRNLVHSLVKGTQSSAPLLHHFGCLASLALCELSKVAETRGEAANLACEILEANIAAGAWTDSIRSLAEDVKSSSGCTNRADAQAAASQGLRHLADLATTGLAAAGDKPETSADEDSAAAQGVAIEKPGSKFNPFAILESGYLKSISRATPEEPSSD